MDTNAATLQLPKDLVESAIKQHVATAMAMAMGNPDRLIADCVHRVLTQKVDSDGKVSSYSSSVEYIQWVMNDALRKAVSEVVTTEVEKYKDTIRKHLAEQLARKNSPLLKQLADQMCGAMMEAAGNKWRLSVSFDKSDR